MGNPRKNLIKDVNYAQVTSEGKLNLWHFNFNTDMPQKPRIMLEDKPHFGKKKKSWKKVFRRYRLKQTRKKFLM